MLSNRITNVITQFIKKIKGQFRAVTYPNPGPYRNPQAPGLGSISIRMLIAQNWPPLATATWGQYTRPMRKYLDIPLTLIVLFALTVAMLWPLDQPPPAQRGR